MPIMRILRGSSASGKSTYRKQFIADNPEWRYTNLDEIRLAFPGLRESEILDTQRAGLIQAMTDGRNVIVDNTHVNPRAIDRLKSLAAHYSYDVEIKEFSIDWQEAILRDKNRAQSVGRSVIIKQHMMLGTYVDKPRNVILVDLDGTLCNIEHRKHYVQSSPKNWPMFFAGISADTVNYPVLSTVRAMYDSGYDIVYLSGRGEEYRGPTEAWLAANTDIPYHALFMRGFNDRRDDAIVKRELYESFVKPYFHVHLVLDDRTRVVDMWRSIGLTCFQVAPGDF